MAASYLITTYRLNTMVYDLKNRNVLVTGGSRGLGAVTAERFAKEGANVAINYATSASAAEELAEKLKATYDVQAAAIQAFPFPLPSQSSPVNPLPQ